MFLKCLGHRHAHRCILVQDRNGYLRCIIFEQDCRDKRGDDGVKQLTVGRGEPKVTPACNTVAASPITPDDYVFLEGG